MSDLFMPQESSYIQKEREVARALKKTRWWKGKIQKGICYHCNQKFSAEGLTMDHLIPLVKGGRSGKNNIVISCKPCNSKKSHATLVEMRLKKI